ncbi:zinc-finger homeodomain protein 2-like [Musa acuminata AAA Group]|uniref:zinc-finger homeodomain protein 2-like n=1 Tax=Musa acuminata AAA Group TaxID=214697 RepID=UPI0031D93086
MEYKDQIVVDDDDDDDDEMRSSTALSFNARPPIRGSAFSKPVLSPSSSLISLRGGGGNGSGTSTAENVSLFGSTTPSSTAAAVDVLYQSAARNTDPAPVSGATAPSNTKAAASASIRYRECLRNHAASIGGHVLDGCGEFMSEGDPSSPEALKCAACGCHRSFHRKEAEGDAAAADSYYRGAARVPLLLPPPPHPQSQHHNHYQKQFQFGTPTTPSSGIVAFGGNASGSGGTTESSSEERMTAGAPTPATTPRKRFRTKFTMEQKEKMLAFAERMGWRIQKQDEGLVEQFCAETGVRRQVLKVWMHNNKHLIRKPQQPPGQDEVVLPQQHQPHSSSQQSQQQM